jgi:hypothetical protein
LLSGAARAVALDAVDCDVGMDESGLVGTKKRLEKWLDADSIESVISVRSDGRRSFLITTGVPSIA